MLTAEEARSWRPRSDSGIAASPPLWLMRQRRWTAPLAFPEPHWNRRSPAAQTLSRSDALNDTNYMEPSTLSQYVQYSQYLKNATARSVAHGDRYGKKGRSRPGPSLPDAP